MIERCSYCGKIISIKRPLLKFGTTHGLCQKCFDKESAKFDKRGVKCLKIKRFLRT